MSVASCKVVAVGSGKGGSGKTKVNAGVACTLAMRPERPKVLLVDACQDQGMLSYMFAAEADTAGKGLGQMIKGVLEGRNADWIAQRFDECKVKVIVGADGQASIDFLPAASEVLGELTINNQWVESQRGMLLTSVMEAIIEHGDYDYVVFDTIPLLRIHTTASVMAITNAFAVTLDCQNMENIAGVDRYIAYARGVGANLAGVIENLYDSKFNSSRLAKQFVDAVCRQSNVPVLVTVPRSASVSNTTLVFDDADGLASGVYVLAEKDKTQRRHLEVVIERFNTITNALLEACNAPCEDAATA